MCPHCGNTESVLQSVTSDEWECRAELGGCGAVIDTPVQDIRVHQDAVQDAVQAMADAIHKFEHQNCPLGHPSLLEMEHPTAELLEVLKYEIGRLATLTSSGP